MQLEKALLPILVNLSEIMIEVKLLQRPKALSPILFTHSLIVTEVIPEL